MEPLEYNASVSVVVPSYNHAQFITRCIRSIINQTQKPLELIVIDDGSDDSSLSVIEKALELCPFDCELLAITQMASLTGGLLQAQTQDR